MKLVVGLGNPGPEYEKSRHNIGFMTAERLQEVLESEPFKIDKKFNASLSKGKIPGESFIIAKPLSFMNLSGEPVGKIANFFKIKDEDIIVVYDDLDLPVGKIRIRKNGNAGTHNGVKSVVQAIGTGFPRVRIGIEGRETENEKKMDSAAYVLSPFKKGEKELVDSAIDSAAEAVTLILKGEIEKAMNRFN